MANLQSLTVSTSGFLLPPKGSTSERPASADFGQIWYNTDTKRLEWFDNTVNAWLLFDTASPPQATGSSISNVTIDGYTYKVHKFLNTGVNTFSVEKAGVFDILIVAGGGAGSTDYSGAGGAGGLIYVENHYLDQGNYTVRVGAGGIGPSTGNTQGTNGKDSQFADLLAKGGGAGSADGVDPGIAGGSGGGGSWSDDGFGLRGARGVPGQGTNGADGGPRTNSHPGGGGGGSGHCAKNVETDVTPSDGGPGLLINIDGNNYFWAAGGGGGQAGDRSAKRAGYGGIGGGGGGSGSIELPGGQGGTNGINIGQSGDSTGGGDAGDNTGSGGGAGAEGATIGGNGGSGIVIIRYRIS